MTEGRVLLVEDDDDLRMTMAALLREEGIKVADVANGVEALAWMHAHGRPAVILLDLMMPRMDGIQFRTAQLAVPELADVPVVLMTASTVHQHLVETCGVDEVIRKPVEFEKLLGVVRRYCNRSSA